MRALQTIRGRILCKAIAYLRQRTIAVSMLHLIFTESAVFKLRKSGPADEVSCLAVLLHVKAWRLPVEHGEKWLRGHSSGHHATPHTISGREEVSS